MPLEQICTILNLFGVLVPVGFSIGMAIPYKQAYFRYWTIAYTLLFVSLTIEFVTGQSGHRLLPTSIQALAYLASGWYSLRMADAIALKSGAGKLSLALAGGMLVLYIGGTLAGLPFEKAFVPGVLYYIGTQMILGWAVTKNPGSAKKAKFWLGGLVAATGLWVLAYLPLVHTSYLWVGFGVSALLHLLLGMGMMLYLLSDIAFRLEKHNEELKSVDRLQADFIGTMSHEFRTPLSAMKVATWLLSTTEKDRLSERGRDTVDILTDNVERFIGLVNDLLDYSKLESGTMSYEYEAIDLGNVVADGARSLIHLFEEKAIYLEIVVPDHQVTVDADSRRIEQVVINLLSNALKFTPNGGRVTVHVTEGEAEARMEVTDSGIGIAPENLRRVFNKFYQVNGTSTRKFGGSGLGLSICKAIVEDGHRGRIWVQSGDVGATFVVTLAR
jgi:signal transduction histidine kinase